MPQVDDNQKAFNASVEDDIRKSIAKDVNADKETDKTEPDDNGQEPVKSSSKEETKKNVDSKHKKADNTTTTDDEPDEAQLFDSIIDKIITDEFGGDEGKRDEAKGIANVAIKTFGGDPIKAAKSYKSLFDQTHSIKRIISSNPFIEKLITEASQGKTIDENYAKELLGTATSADEPTKTKTTQAQNQLEDDPLDDFDPDSITTDQLFESGVLDKTKYETASSIDKRDMLEKAKIRYGYKVLPEKMAEKAVRLTQKKTQDAAQQRQIQQAKDTNKQRLLNSRRDLIMKYNVDFDGNPEHAQLYEEIYNKAVKIPDLDDESNYLVSEDAFEQAAKHVFKSKGISLTQAKVVDEPDNPSERKTPLTTVKSNSAEIMRRILSGANGFKGTASKRQQQVQREKTTGNDLNSKVNERVNDELNRSRTTTKMISGVRKTDRVKS